MLTLIYGDNIQASRNYYFDLKQKFINAKSLDGEKFSLTDLTEAVEGNGLFVINDAVFIEQLFSKRKAGAELDSIIVYLNKDHSVRIILWEAKELTKIQIGKLKKAEIKLFSYPKTLFQLLDSLKPGNGKQLVTLFQQTLETEAPELILFMLTKQVRILLALQDPVEDNIDEIKRIQPWQLSKMQKQAKYFTVEQLKYLHSKLYEFDLGYKTGGLAMSLTASLDFLFIEI